MRKAPSYSPLSLSISLAGPTRSNDSAKPRKKAIESFSIRKIFCACELSTPTTSNSRLTVSLEIKEEML